MHQNLACLKQAIIDAGSLNWYAQRYPNSVQLEFIHTQLYDKNQQKPLYQIALNFSQLQSVTIFATTSHQLDWCERLHQDKLEETDLVDSSLSFQRDQIDFSGFSAKRILFQGEKAENIQEFSLIFGTYGIQIYYQVLKVYAPDEINLNQIPQFYEDWWNYWKEYHHKKEQGIELEKDWLCETIVPLK